MSRVFGAGVLVLLASQAGCVSNEGLRIVIADRPGLGLGIERFEVAGDSVCVIAKAGSFGIETAAGRRCDALVVRPGESFRVRGFNRSEQWRLRALRAGHAVFDVHGNAASCVGVPPFGPQVWRIRATAVVCPGCEPANGPAGN